MEELTASHPLLSEHREHWTNECVTTNKFTHTERTTERNDTRCCTREGGKEKEGEREGAKIGWDKEKKESGAGRLRQP